MLDYDDFTGATCYRLTQIEKNGDVTSPRSSHLETDLLTTRQLFNSEFYPVSNSSMGAYSIHAYNTSDEYHCFVNVS